MKKILLPGILALAVLLIAGYGVNRSMNSYGDLSDMALKNVLALADGEDPEDPDPGEDDGGGTSNPENDCRELPGGIWNEALYCADGGSATVKCTVKGQLNFAGKVINGNYEVGVEYPILWERWECKLSPSNCCNGNEQGVGWV